MGALTQTRNVCRSIDLYAAPSADPSAIRQLVQRLLPFSFQRSDSRLRVPAYRYRGSAGEIVDIQQNEQEHGLLHAEPDLPPNAVLIRAHGFDDEASAHIRATLENHGFKLLKQEVL